MENRPTAIERAFALARGGRMTRMGDIRKTLQVEGYQENGQLFGRSIRAQLVKLIAEAKTKAEE
jgi:hypothetical protein